MSCKPKKTPALLAFLVVASIVALTLHAPSITTLFAQTGAIGYPYPALTDSSVATLPPYPPPFATNPPPSFPPPSLPTTQPETKPAPSDFAFKAASELALKLGISSTNLIIVTDHPVRYPSLAQEFQAVTLLDARPEGRFYDFLIDRQTGQVHDAALIRTAEGQANQAKYGKLQPALYERLQTMKDDETVAVLIWAAATPDQSLSERESAARDLLAAKYPQVREAVERGGKPMDVDDPTLARQIESEYIGLIEADTASRANAVSAYLTSLDAEASTISGMPAVTATLTKQAILQLTERNDVGGIYLFEGGERSQELQAAVPTNLAPTVWGLGFDGTGVNIAILEEGNVDFTFNVGGCPNSNNCFRHPGIRLFGAAGILTHTTLVASSAASDNSTFRGMAPGATIISAGIPGPERQHDIEALVWALDQSADVVNASYGWCASPLSEIDVIDKAFDYYARSRNRLIVKSAGNFDHCQDYHVSSPGKGWNVLTVGAYDDNNNADWSDDVDMASFSNWMNPDSLNSDHEKPEIAAPGVTIGGIALQGNGAFLSGTSFAAPQASGMAALMIHRNSSLRFWPEASRAIIVASATHNIVGPTSIPAGQDLRDGAGGINAALADTVARTRNTSDVNPCTTSCWWGFSISDPGDNTIPMTYRYFTAQTGDFIRVGIAWWSNADCQSTSACSYDQLTTDIHMGVLDPDSQWVAWSASWDNNYELVEFIAPKTGTYRIGFVGVINNETSNYAGLALLRLYRHYLPIIMKEP